MKRGMLLLGLLVVISLVISGCTEYPPQYSSPKEDVGEVDLPSSERIMRNLQGCVSHCDRLAIACHAACDGLPEFEWAQCTQECYNRYNNCVAGCEGEYSSEI